MAKSKENDEQEQPRENERPPAGALVPIEHHADIVEGVQAYRRGDMIFYTVRGEPEIIHELVGELNRSGVQQVVALISHPAPDTAEHDVPAIEDQQNPEEE